MKSIHAYVAVLLAGATLAGHAGAAVTAPAGYIYSTQLLSSLTQGCVAAGPGGTFVGIGATFTANAEAIVLAKESGELRLVHTLAHQVPQVPHGLRILEGRAAARILVAHPPALQLSVHVFEVLVL